MAIGQAHHDNEQQPLLQGSTRNHDTEVCQQSETIKFEEDDAENPRNWSKWRKRVNVVVIAAMAVLSPLASSMFTPGIDQIAQGLNTKSEMVIACTTGFVIMLGIGPLVQAPLSESFGRRKLYLINFSIFALLQIPSAFASNIETLIAMRTLSGFFGSVGIANGGGTLSDMFEPSERATVFGWYLLGPLLGPALGPLIGGFIVQELGWRWIFLTLTILAAVNTLAGFFFLRESYAPVILARRKQMLMRKEHKSSDTYCFEGEDARPLHIKLRQSLTRPFLILSQPIVLVMSLYQGFTFSTSYSLFTNMQPIFQGDYGFDTELVGLLYLGPGLGFLFSASCLVPQIDTIYNALSKRHGGARPEFRLPLAVVGAVFLPSSLFWFAWTVAAHAPWYVPIIGTFFYGIGQVLILNTTQNYYIDTFEKYAASAIAAGGVFRSVLGGIVPLFSPALFDKLGYGWGISVFAFFAVAIAPAPVLFYCYGQKIRERFFIQF